MFFCISFFLQNLKNKSHLQVETNLREGSLAIPTFLFTIGQNKICFRIFGSPQQQQDGRRSISETRDVRKSRPTSARFPTWPVLPTFTTHSSSSYGQTKNVKGCGEKKNYFHISVQVQNVKEHMIEVVRNHLLASQSVLYYLGQHFLLLPRPADALNRLTDLCSDFGSVKCFGKVQPELENFIVNVQEFFWYQVGFLYFSYPKNSYVPKDYCSSRLVETTMTVNMIRNLF